MEYSIQQLAKVAGVSSRTLRHYDEIGILPASRAVTSGYRVYDEAGLARLQRILLLRDLGLDLASIARVLEGEVDRVAALQRHLELLFEERERLQRRITSVRSTIDAMREGGALMPETMFDGFDSSEHTDEAAERWGREAAESGAAWWEQLGDDGRAAHRVEQDDIAAGFRALAASDRAADSAEAQALAQRQYDWVVAGWQGRRPSAAEFAGLAEMYVADPRFARVYAPAEDFVRDALVAFAAAI